MVAKSFQSMKQFGEPFNEKGRMYVNVQNEKTGKIRKVRWYESKEYEKLYKKESFIRTSPKVFKTQKEVLGFEKGYVTIFKGDTYSHLEWFRDSIARYCRWWGWYIISTEEVPADVPEDLESVRLPWELVGEGENVIADEKLLKSKVNTLLYDPTASQFVGSIGERLTLNVEVVEVHKDTSYYGEYTAHYLKDECGNHYVWNTGSKSWEPGSRKLIKATVKDHNIVRNVNTTVLSRCIEIAV